jgi:hypothetical protein
MHAIVLLLAAVTARASSPSIDVNPATVLPLVKTIASARATFAAKLGSRAAIVLYAATTVTSRPASASISGRTSRASCARKMRTRSPSRADQRARQLLTDELRRRHVGTHPVTAKTIGGRGSYRRYFDASENASVCIERSDALEESVDAVT